MAELWNTVLYFPLLNSLIGLARLTGDLGWSIILLTVGLRLAMTPLVLPSLRASKKMQGLSGELAILKSQYKNDKQGLVTAQAELYKKHGLNPASGCLPQIVQILILIALFNAFNSVLKPNGAGLVGHLNPLLYSFNQLPGDFRLSTRFYTLDLTQPDTFKVAGLPVALPGAFLLVAGVIQLFSSKMMLPAVKTEEKAAQKTPEGTDDVMAATQEQMLYLFPLMTILFGLKFPSGLVLYWLVFSLVSLVQQYYASGWGGLTPWLKKVNLVK